jgi:hypothetical protein
VEVRRQDRSQYLRCARTEKELKKDVKRSNWPFGTWAIDLSLLLSNPRAGSRAGHLRSEGIPAAGLPIHVATIADN